MKIDEAIKHCQEVAKGKDDCAEQHEQLSEWLLELKELRINKENMINEIGKAFVSLDMFFKFDKSNKYNLNALIDMAHNIANTYERLHKIIDLHNISKRKTPVLPGTFVEKVLKNYEKNKYGGN